jgi:putative acetyltransferase
MTEWFTMIIRNETAADVPAIRSLVRAAFADAPHSSGTEADIVDALRKDGALTVSLVADDDGKIIGHVALSPVTIGSEDIKWFGLGPLAVQADRRHRGIAQALVEAGLRQIQEIGAQGCVVLGDPAYYCRFGFESDLALRFEGVPPAYFQKLAFSSVRPTGVVRYHSAFHES